jgi:ribonuclease HII
MTNKHEKKLYKQGYDFIVGMDEVGRGSWAGPMIAGAVVLPKGFKNSEVADSKKISPKKRELLFVEIVNQSLAWSVGIVSHQEIDEIGIIQANKKAFERALEQIEKQLEPDFIYIDGVKIFEPFQPHEFVIKGDDKIISIACASIIAKVVRDKILTAYHKVYPEYNFHEHKGYGTAGHLKKIEDHGVSEVHRLSYRPVDEILNKMIN